MHVRERAMWSGPALGGSLLGDSADPPKWERERTELGGGQMEHGRGGIVHAQSN